MKDVVLSELRYVYNELQQAIEYLDYRKAKEKDSSERKGLEREIHGIEVAQRMIERRIKEIEGVYR